MQRLTGILIALAAAAGCITQPADFTPDTSGAADAGDPDTGQTSDSAAGDAVGADLGSSDSAIADAVADAPVVDFGADGTADTGDDMGPDTDLWPDMPVDTGPDLPPPEFAYVPLLSRRVLELAPEVDVDEDSPFFRDHLRLGLNASLTRYEITTDTVVPGQQDLVFFGPETRQYGGVVEDPIIEAQFAPLPDPILVTNVYAWDNLDMVNVNGTYAGDTQLVIDDPTHPLAAGMSGTVDIGQNVTGIGYREEYGAGAQHVAHASTVMAGWSGIFGYEPGASMLPLSAPRLAPARRTGWGIDDAEDFEWSTWQLFDAAYHWSMADSPPAVDEVCHMLVGTVPASQGELHVASRLALHGCDVQFHTSAATVPDPGFLFVSPTAASSEMALVSNRSGAILAAINMTVTNALKLGSATTGHTLRTTDWSLNPDVDPNLRANLNDAVISYDHAAYAMAQPLPPDAWIVAYRSLSTLDLKMMWAFDVGAGLADGTPAPGPRVGYGFPTNTLSSMSDDALALLDAAIQWLMWRE